MGDVGVAWMPRDAADKRAYPDRFAFDPQEHYYDAKSDPEKPRWFMVDAEFVEKFPGIVALPRHQGSLDAE